MAVSGWKLARRVSGDCLSVRRADAPGGRTLQGLALGIWRATRRFRVSNVEAAARSGAAAAVVGVEGWSCGR